jgi:HAD superfamily hydrolase (TIGR01549 family)
MNRNEINLNPLFNVSQVKGLLFDVDGTLSDTDDRMIARLSRWIKPFFWMRKGDKIEHIARSIVMAMETPANFFYHLADRVHLDNFLSKVYNRFSHTRHEKDPAEDRFWIIPGVKTMLDYFHRRLPMAVVSARDERSTRLFLEHFDLMHYFDVIVTSQTCIHTKPFPDPVIYAAWQIGLHPEDCVMIGDTIVDMKAGQSAGAQTIGVLCGFGSRKELERAGANLIVESTPDIQELFQ